MNNDFANTLVIPAVERAALLMQTDGFDGALVWADGVWAAGGEKIRLQLDDYWAEGPNGPLMDVAELATAIALASREVKRLVFVTPLSYEVTESGQFNTAHSARLEPKLIWALCYEEGSGYDICAMHYVQRPNGTFSFEEDITMLTGEQQLMDGAPGFAMLKSYLEVA